MIKRLVALIAGCILMLAGLAIITLGIAASLVDPSPPIGGFLWLGLFLVIGGIALALSSK
jgi:hypothetical protein